MKEDARISNFKVAYHNDAPGGFMLSNGSVGHSHHGMDMGKMTVHKRAVSSKKARVNKKKVKNSSSNMARIVDPSYG